MTTSSKLDGAREVDAVLARGSNLEEHDFEVLYLHYKPALVRFAARQRTSDPEGVADLALFDAYRAFERLEGRTEPAFRSYLFRAARSQAVADHRRGGPDTTALTGEDRIEASAIDELVEAEWVHSLVEQLSPDQRRVIESRFFDDLTAAATARRLNRSPNAVYQLQHRALRRLRMAVLAAAALVALVVVLLALTERDGTHSLVDRSPADRSEAPTPTVDDGLGLRVGGDGPQERVATPSGQRPSPAGTGFSAVAGEATTTSGHRLDNAGIDEDRIDEDGLDSDRLDSDDLDSAARPAIPSMQPSTASTGGPATTAATAERPTTAATALRATTTSSQASSITPDTSAGAQTTSTVPSTSSSPQDARTCNGEVVTIVGSGVIVGTYGPDVILGGNGKDVIHGLGGNDTICGGNGKDQLFGGPGDDTLIGGNGKDQLFGEAGGDTLIGGGGTDELDGGDGTNTLIEDGD